MSFEDRHDDSRQIAHRPATRAAVQIDQRIGCRALRTRLQDGEAQLDARPAGGVVVFRHVDTSADHGLALDLGCRQRSRTGLDGHRIFRSGPAGGNGRKCLIGRLGSKKRHHRGYDLLGRHGKSLHTRR